MDEGRNEHASVFNEMGLTGWHFSKVVKDIFNKVAGLEIIEEKYSPNAEDAFNSQISCIMILNGEKDIMISISMSYKTAGILVAYMSNLPQAEIKLEEQSDGVVEISNMISGQTKAKLASMGYHYTYMQPFTIVGDNHRILQKNKVSSMQFKFHSGAVEMLMCVSIQ